MRTKLSLVLAHKTYLFRKYVNSNIFSYNNVIARTTWSRKRLQVTGRS